MDLVFRGAQVADGTGDPITRHDVGVTDGRIASVAETGSLAGKRTIDAADLVLAPGFIDMHSHSDLQVGVRVHVDEPGRQHQIGRADGPTGTGARSVSTWTGWIRASRSTPRTWCRRVRCGCSPSGSTTGRRPTPKWSP